MLPSSSLLASPLSVAEQSRRLRALLSKETPDDGTKRSKWTRGMEREGMLATRFDLKCDAWFGRVEQNAELSNT